MKRIVKYVAGALVTAALMWSGVSSTVSTAAGNAAGDAAVEICGEACE